MGRGAIDRWAEIGGAGKGRPSLRHRASRFDATIDRQDIIGNAGITIYAYLDLTTGRLYIRSNMLQSFTMNYLGNARYLWLCAALIVLSGCATKKYVTQQVAPVESHVGAVESKNDAKNADQDKAIADQGKQIVETSSDLSRTKERLTDTDAKATAAGQAAQAADQRAQIAQQEAVTARAEIEKLTVEVQRNQRPAGDWRTTAGCDGLPRSIFRN
jgi:hypothetical protein